MRAMLLLLSLTTGVILSAQSISGKLVDEKQKPIRSATLFLLKQSDSSLVKSAISDNDGNFLFNELGAGKYLLQIAVVSHQRLQMKTEVNDKNINLGAVALVPEATTLTEVKVTATKPFLEQKADKLIVNVESSGTAAGATALEVLQKVPGILVRNETVTMVGKGAPAIYVDGRLSQYTDIAQLLRDISAANVEKIEVIANPGAKYDAAGGAVINIILKRTANLGTNGSVYLTGGLGLYDREKIHSDRTFYRLNPGFTINNRAGKVNLYGGYSFLRRTFFNYSEFDREISPSRFFQVNYNPEDVNSHNFRAGLDYFADKRNTFGVMFRGFAREGVNEAQNTTYESNLSTGQQVSSFQTLNDKETKRTNLAANVNWKHSFDSLGTDLNVDLDYSRFKLKHNSEITNVLQNNSSYISNQLIDNPVQFVVARADFTKQLSKTAKLEAGAKSSYATIDNYLTFTQKGILNTGRSTEFNYKENINALYSSVSVDLDKWQFQAGLRGEQTIAKGNSKSVKVLDRSYWQLFPSAFLSYKINEKMATVLQYSRRVNRPSYQQQNPFIEYFDSLTYTRGNPLIKPETADGYKISLTYQNQPFIAFSYNKKQDVIVDDAPKQEGNLTYTTPENLASYENMAIELNFPLNFGKKISGYGGNQAIYNHYRASYLGGTFDRSRWHWLAYWQVAYKPTDTWNFEVGGFYMTKFMEEFITIDKIGAFNFGITKIFWDKKARLVLNVSDLFYSQKTTGTLQFQQINIGLYQLEETRNLRLTFRYNFGNQKLKAARNRTTASDAEEGRVKTQ